MAYGIPIGQMNEVFALRCLVDIAWRANNVALTKSIIDMNEVDALRALVYQSYLRTPVTFTMPIGQMNEGYCLRALALARSRAQSLAPLIAIGQMNETLALQSLVYFKWVAAPRALSKNSIAGMNELDCLRMLVLMGYNANAA